ncbi:MAG: energy transducer TonB [Aureibaculum sp.]|nr:energy transducer TonB [Aureibaculum sp.]
MKNLINILFSLFTIGMVTTTFAQTCNITLDDILAINSQESFERVLIENNFQALNSDEDWKKYIRNISKKDTLVLGYEFEGTIKNSYFPELIVAAGYFFNESEIDSGDGYLLKFAIKKPRDEDSFYNLIFSEVKRKCTFDKVHHTDDGEGVAFYNCSNARVKNKIGFSLVDGGGLIIIKPADDYKEIGSLHELRKWEDKKISEESDKRKRLDDIMGGLNNSDGNATGDPNASGYYGNGGDYGLVNRKAVSKPKPTYDCNEQGRVVVSISVDKSGRVISAQAGIKGTTNSAPCLLTRAKEAALKTRFNSDSKAPTKQVGSIIYNFSLSN